MSVVLKTRFHSATDGLQIPAQTQPVQSSARVVPLVTLRRPQPRPGIWTIPVMLMLFFGSIIALFWYASSIMEVLRPPALEPGMVMPDPEQASAYAETVTPPFTDVIAPIPTAPNLPQSAVPVAAAKSNPNDGIALPTSSLQVPYGAAPDPSSQDSKIAAIADQIKDTAALADAGQTNPQARVTMKSNDASIDALLDKAQAKLDADDNKGAIAVYDRILAHDHDNREALTGKGSALKLTGQYQEAASVYRHLLKLNTKDETARVNLVSALGEIGTVATSDELQHYVTQSPDFAAAQAALAQALVKQNKALAALPHVWRAAELEPDNVLFRLDLAITYDKLGHSGEAVEFYRAVLKDVDLNGGDQTADLPISLPEIQRRADYLEKMLNSAGTLASAARDQQ